MKTFTFKNFLEDSMEPLAQELLSHCVSLQVHKGEHLLRAGEIKNETYYVEKGLLRQFSIDSKGKEHIIQFAPENWFVSNRQSEYLQQPSSYYIEAVEDSTVRIVTGELIQKLSEDRPVFIDFNIKLLHRHIASLQKRITQLQSNTAQERYLDFIKTYPNVLMRVPQTYVASYLGITPESLSRVRKELAKGYPPTS